MCLGGSVTYASLYVPPELVIENIDDVQPICRVSELDGLAAHQLHAGRHRLQRSCSGREYLLENLNRCTNM